MTPRYDNVVSSTLSRLRQDLDFMPSPIEEQPGLLIRDSFHYSEAVIVIPPPLVQCLACFDGQQTALDLRQLLVKVTGDLQVGEIADQLTGALSLNGFLEDENYQRMKAEREQAFAEAPVREASHAGTAYPADAESLRETMAEWMGGDSAPASGLIGIAAPHVSPGGGYDSYRAAYRLLGPEYKDRTFVILGTSHYGASERFGLTRKPYATPYGEAAVNLDLHGELMRLAPGSIANEDYCHAVEHSIEFQVLFLQSIYGPEIKILPILCGSYARSIYQGGMPEDDENVNRFLGTLGEIGAREADKLFWVLGIDMAHMGRRYGDDFDAIAGQEAMAEVAEMDKDRMGRMNAGDVLGFWDRVQENHDELKWCGSSPVYTFLKAMPSARGTLERYEQWNIDAQSVVSFAGMSFRG